MKTIKDINIKKGDRVLLRVDFNVSVKDGKVQDDFRIQATLPTINYLIQKQARVLILAHLGRPEGKFDDSLSLMPIAEHLSKLTDQKIKFFEALEIAEIEMPNMKNGEIAILENIRFDKREKEGSEEFAKELSSLADIYINDAFGVSHREHTSVFYLPKELLSAAGLLVEKEVEVLNEIRNNPSSPLVFIMGGAKVETKLNTLYKLFTKIDHVCLGGLLANSVLKIRGIDIGKSKHKEDIGLVKVGNMNFQDKKIHLPIDVVVSEDTSGKKPIRISNIEDVKKNEMILDAGPDTVREFSNLIKKAGMVVWNGPLGYIESNEFARGTRQVARSLLQTDAKVVVGGGDLMKIIDEVGADNKIYYTSTGGGAMLEYLAEGTLPGIQALD